MRIVVVQDGRELGYQRVLIGLNVEPDMIDEAANRLAEIPEVGGVMFCGGSHDVFGWAVVKSIDDLSELLRLQVGKIRGVKSVNTFVELENRKVGRCLSLPAKQCHIRLD